MTKKLKPAQPVAPKHKLIVISDTHFGHKDQLLHDADLVDRFMEVLAGRGEIDELILLGDILDLWAKTKIPSLRSARYFIESLTDLPNVDKIVYVPGNHDHQFFLDEFRDEIDTRIQQGDLSPARFMTARHYEGSILSGLARPGSKVSFSIDYPFIIRKVDGREVLLTHGHHLDYYDTSWGWASTFWFSRRVIRKRTDEPTLHAIEMSNLPFCGTMTMAPWVPEMVAEGLKYYRVILFFSKLFRMKGMQESPRRDTLIKENYDEILGLLPLFEHPRPGCFIFGHTHRPGIGKIPDTEITVANSGCWLKPEKEGVDVMTWIEVEHDVKLYYLGTEGPVLKYSEHIGMW